MITIKILDIEPANREKLAQMARHAASYMGIEVKVIEVKENEGISKYQLPATPGLVIDEKVVCAGRIPEQAEVMTWVADAELARG